MPGRRILPNASPVSDEENAEQDVQIYLHIKGFDALEIMLTVAVLLEKNARFRTFLLDPALPPTNQTLTLNIPFPDEYRSSMTVPLTHLTRAGYYVGLTNTSFRDIVRAVEDCLFLQGLELYGALPIDGARVEEWRIIEAHSLRPILIFMINVLATKWPSILTEKQRGNQPFTCGSFRDLEDQRPLSQFKALLECYDEHLSHRKYLAGELFTFADLCHLPGLHWFMNVYGYNIWVSESGSSSMFPAVRAWWEDISSRPAWRRCVEASQESDLQSFEEVIQEGFDLATDLCEDLLQFSEPCFQRTDDNCTPLEIGAMVAQPRSASNSPTHDAAPESSEASEHAIEQGGQEGISRGIESLMSSDSNAPESSAPRQNGIDPALLPIRSNRLVSLDNDAQESRSGRLDLVEEVNQVIEAALREQRFTSTIVDSDAPESSAARENAIQLAPQAQRRASPEAQLLLEAEGVSLPEAEQTFTVTLFVEEEQFLTKSVDVMLAIAVLLEKMVTFRIVLVDAASLTEEVRNRIAHHGFEALFGEELYIYVIKCNDQSHRNLAEQLEGKFGDTGIRLYGDTLEDRACIGIWRRIEESQLRPTCINLISKRFICIESTGRGFFDPEFVLRVDRVLHAYEEQLSKTRFLAGDFFSFADLCQLPDFHWLINMCGYNLWAPDPDSVNSLPSLKRWWEEVSARPTWRKCVEASRHTDVQSFQQVLNNYMESIR